MDQGYAANDASCEYRSPFSSRYASKEMQYNFSDKKKFSTWRKLWTYLAKAEKMLKLYKPIGEPQFADTKVEKKMSLYLENKQNNHLLAPQLLTASQGSSYEEQWLQSQSATQDSFSSLTDSVMLRNDLNQSSSCCPQWYSNGIIQRPQSILEHGSKTQLGYYQDIGCYSQDTEQSNSNSCMYRQLVSRHQPSLMRSTDSSLYSDPDCPRPLSSDSSTGSTRSSCSLSGSSWDSSTAGPNCSAGSVGNSICWERSLSNSSDIGQKKQMLNHQSRSTLWRPEEKSSSLYSTDLNDAKLGIWSSCLQAHEDYELIDNLFMKDENALGSSNFSYQDINHQFEGLSLHDSMKSSSYITTPKRPLYSSNVNKLFS